MNAPASRAPLDSRAGLDAQFAHVLAQQPAVVGRLCRWGRPGSEDLAAEVLALVHKGVILVEEDSRIDARGKLVGDYRLTCVVEKTQACIDPIEQATLKLLFGVVGEGERSLLCGDLHLFARMEADAFSRAVRSWQAALSEEMKRLRLISRLSLFLRLALPITAGFTVLAGFLGLLATGEALSLLACAVVAIMLLAFNVCAPWLTSHGSTLMGESRRLRDALREGDLEALDPDAASGLSPYAFVLREADAPIFADLPLSRGFVKEIAQILSHGAFAAESIIAQQSAGALNSAVNAAMGGGPAGVTGLGNPHVDAGDLFVKRPSRRKRGASNQA